MDSNFVTILDCNSEIERQILVTEFVPRLPDDDSQARSSVGERYLDVVDVGGSIPPAPTR